MVKQAHLDDYEANLIYSEEPEEILIVFVVFILGFTMK
jgi:hypothetical protein